MKKQISWPWFFIRLLPVFILIIYMIGNMGNTNGITGQNIAHTIELTASTFPSIPIIEDALEYIINVITDETSGNYYMYPMELFVIRYIAYLVFIEIFKIIYEVIVFLPKFCTSIFERKTKEK